MKFFYFSPFQGQAPPKPLSRYPKAFQTWLQIRRDIRDFGLTLPIVYSGESIFPVSWKVWKVANLRIVYCRELLQATAYK
jgi:hypothetical protein